MLRLGGNAFQTTYENKKRTISAKRSKAGAGRKDFEGRERQVAGRSVPLSPFRLRSLRLSYFPDNSEHQDGLKMEVENLESVY